MSQGHQVNEQTPAARISERERVDFRVARKRIGIPADPSELQRGHDFSGSRPSIEKVLRTMEPRPRLVRSLVRKGSKRYAK